MQLVIIADEQCQRLALSDTAHALGLIVANCMDSQQLLAQAPKGEFVWLIDVAQYNSEMAECVQQSAPIAVVTGFDRAPYLSSDAYPRWQKALKRKLLAALKNVAMAADLTFALPDIAVCAPKKPRAWQ